METADGLAASESGTGSHWFQLGKNTDRFDVIELGYCYAMSICVCVCVCVCVCMCMCMCVCVCFSKRWDYGTVVMSSPSAYSLTY